jgi:hypothetical protein
MSGLNERVSIKTINPGDTTSIPDLRVYMLKLKKLEQE